MIARPHLFLVFFLLGPHVMPVQESSMTLFFHRKLRELVFFV
jgi:hypothetical protein